MFDRALFKYMVDRKQLTLSDVANQLGINDATLYRKMKGESDFSRSEIQMLKSILGMTTEESISVFFAN